MRFSSGMLAHQIHYNVWFVLCLVVCWLRGFFLCRWLNKKIFCSDKMRRHQDCMLPSVKLFCYKIIIVDTMCTDYRSVINFKVIKVYSKMIHYGKELFKNVFISGSLLFDIEKAVLLFFRNKPN